MVSSSKEGPLKDRNSPSRRPAMTTEAIQNRLIALAHEEAERQILAGTASSQIITQLLKQGGRREELELEKLQKETELASAKVLQLESAARAEELFEKAMDAFRGYQPSQDDDIV